MAAELIASVGIKHAGGLAMRLQRIIAIPLSVFLFTACGGGGGGGGGTVPSTPPPTPPAVPTGLTATPGNGQVSLAWNGSAGAASYKVSRGAVSGGPYSTIATGQTITSYLDNTVTNGTTYYYVVSAVNGAGESTASAQASATPVAPPAAPTGLTATSGSRQVSLAWNASTGAASYTIIREGGGSTFSPIANGVAATNYTDNTVTNGTTYHYWVEAVNAAGSSELSNSVKAVPTSCVALASGLTFQNQGSRSTGFALSAIVADSDQVYWFDYNASLGNNGGAIKSIAKTGGAITVVASGLGGVNAFTVDANNVYWTEFAIADGNGSVKQVPKVGGVPITLATAFFPTGIAVDSTTVFYSGDAQPSNGTKRVPIGGGTVTDVSVGTGSFEGVSLALDADFIYGVDGGSARRILKTGGTVEGLATGLSNAFGAVLDNSSLYWAELVDPGKIGKTSKTGGGATYLATGIRNPHNVALDSNFAYFDRGAPVNGSQVIAKVPLTGGQVVTATDSGCFGQYVAVDGTHIFMSLFGNEVAGDGKILRSDK